jgi:hypothetical protein
MLFVVEIRVVASPRAIQKQKYTHKDHKQAPENLRDTEIVREENIYIDVKRTHQHQH